MRILFAVLLMLMFAVAIAAPPSRVFTYTAGGIIQPSEVTSNEDAIFGYLSRGVDTLAANSVETADLQSECVTSAKILDGTIVSADISATAAIPYSKLSLGTSILGTDLATDIAISTTGTIATTSTTTTSGLSVTSAIKDKDGDWPTQDGQVLVSSKGLVNWTNGFPWTKVCWVTFNMATNAIKTSYPLGATITNIGVGSDTLNLPVTFANTNYCVIVSSGYPGGSGMYNAGTKAVGTVDIYNYDAASILTDCTDVSVFCFE